MICYRDRTFCKSSVDRRCVKTDCFRYFDEAHDNAARQLKLPVCWGEFWDTCEVKIQAEPHEEPGPRKP